MSAERVGTSRIFEFRGDIKSVGGEDYFKGKIGETAVEFSEVWVTTTRQDKGKTEESTDVGLFLITNSFTWYSIWWRLCN